MTDWLWCFLMIVMGYLLADFLVGVMHWMKDSYFTPFTPIIGKTFIWGSRLHHVKPRYVTQFSDWELVKSSAKWCLLWMIWLFLWFGLHPALVAFLVAVSLNDVVHKYAHMLESERPFWVTYLQNAKIWQSHDEHHTHHVEPYLTNYCPITGFVNPVLERLNFWRRMETFVMTTFGIKARADVDEYVEDENYPAGIKFIQKI